MTTNTPSGTNFRDGFPQELLSQPGGGEAHNDGKWRWFWGKISVSKYYTYMYIYTYTYTPETQTDARRSHPLLKKNQFFFFSTIMLINKGCLLHGIEVKPKLVETKIG